MREREITSPDIPSALPGASAPTVLIVDDDPQVAAAHARVLRDVTSAVAIASDATQALARLETATFDVVLSDVQMPNMTGTEFLRAVRRRDLDLPVIFVTGAPSVESAAAAVELGAFRYLTKPVATIALRDAVAEAARVRAFSRSRDGSEARSGLERSLRSAIARLRMAYQPIVAAATCRAIAHEALMRSGEPALPSPPAVLDAAEKLGALHVLGRHVRNLVSVDIDAADCSVDFYVNLHSADLADPDLYDRGAPLSRHARRVVLEVTERASLESISDLDARREELRGMGYRLAVDDLGAGYAGLSYFARLRPELVKIDMSLVRGVNDDPVKQRVVASLVNLAAALGMEIVAEGVETVQERDAVVHLGCTFVQGYGLAKPGPPFPEAHWA